MRRASTLRNEGRWASNKPFTPESWRHRADEGTERQVLTYCSNNLECETANVDQLPKGGWHSIVWPTMILALDRVFLDAFIWDTGLVDSVERKERQVLTSEIQNARITQSGKRQLKKEDSSRLGAENAGLKKERKVSLLTIITQNARALMWTSFPRETGFAVVIDNHSCSW